VIVTLVFVLSVVAFCGWWLSQQRLTAKPWLEEGAAGELSGGRSSTQPTAKIGLGVFLAVVGSLFALFISAYSMRMSLGDWRALPVPPLLWLNTGVLVFSSLALQYAVVSARRGRRDDTRIGLLAGGMSALAFLAGQLLAWQQLVAAGYFLAANPANAFFYLITAVHGLHLVGGMVALARAGHKAWGSGAFGRVQLSVELCAIYWHFLLLVWALVFALLLAGTNEMVADFIIRCNSLVFGLN
jgi:cytochrome c oxidase subunit III